jgi:hypothetical protein
MFSYRRARSVWAVSTSGWSVAIMATNGALLFVFDSYPDDPGLFFDAVAPQGIEPNAYGFYWIDDRDPHQVCLGARMWIVTGFLSCMALYLSHRLRPIRRQAGMCPSCGCDMRATPERCPECGFTSTVPAPADGTPPAIA